MFVSGALAASAGSAACSTSCCTSAEALAGARLGPGICAAHALRRGRQSVVSRPTRCGYQTDSQRDLGSNLPAAPPMRAAPPPPPPPPPPEQPQANGLSGLSRRGLLAAMVGGAGLWWFGLRQSVPLVGVDRRRNIALLRTKGGNLLAATQDEAGRVFLFDKAGNIYYDTEDPRLGMYIVDGGGDVFNEFVDEQGRVQRVPVGNIADLTTIQAQEIGGVPVQELQKSIKGFRGGRITGFVQEADPDNLADYMPPNAPAGVAGDGSVVEPPAMLEDLELDLEPKGGLFSGPPPPVDLDTLRTLRRQ